MIDKLILYKYQRTPQKMSSLWEFLVFLIAPSALHRHCVSLFRVEIVFLKAVFLAAKPPLLYTEKGNGRHGTCTDRANSAENTYFRSLW